jgi:hypothetical protein
MGTSTWTRSKSQRFTFLINKPVCDHAKRCRCIYYQWLGSTDNLKHASTIDKEANPYVPQPLFPLCLQALRVPVIDKLARVRRGARLAARVVDPPALGPLRGGAAAGGSRGRGCRAGCGCGRGLGGRGEERGRRGGLGRAAGAAGHAAAAGAAAGGRSCWNCVN